MRKQQSVECTYGLGLGDKNPPIMLCSNDDYLDYASKVHLLCFDYAPCSTFNYALIKSLSFFCITLLICKYNIPRDIQNSRC